MVVVSMLLPLGGAALAATWSVQAPGGGPADLSPSGPYLTSIQAALGKANPGDIIELAVGEYFEDIHSVQDATPSQPITIRGSRGSVIRGSGHSSRIIQINHDYHHLVGFTVDGLVGKPDAKDSYRDKLVYVHGRRPYRGVEGTLIDGLELRNAGGECLRLRYFVTHSEIRNSRFIGCGVHDFKFPPGGKNGEAIYLGTSSTQWADGKNPTDGPDRTTDNWVHHNAFQTWGNECVDIKEGAERNLVEHNLCEQQLDPQSGGFDSRGDNNVFRYNTVRNNRGAAFRLGGHVIAGHAYGVDNQVYGNIIGLNDGGGVKIMVHPQERICGNQFQHAATPRVVGKRMQELRPDQPCTANTVDQASFAASQGAPSVPLEQRALSINSNDGSLEP